MIFAANVLMILLTVLAIPYAAFTIVPQNKFIIIFTPCIWPNTATLPTISHAENENIFLNTLLSKLQENLHSTMFSAIPIIYDG